jgi:hypothetical protein
MITSLQRRERVSSLHAALTAFHRGCTFGRGTNALIRPDPPFAALPSDLSQYLSAKYLANLSTSPDHNANIASAQTWFQVKGGVSGGTVASAYAIAAMGKEEKKAGVGEFALCTSESASCGPWLLHASGSDPTLWPGHQNSMEQQNLQDWHSTTTTRSSEAMVRSGSWAHTTAPSSVDRGRFSNHRHLQPTDRTARLDIPCSSTVWDSSTARR